MSTIFDTDIIIDAVPAQIKYNTSQSPLTRLDRMSPGKIENNIPKAQFIYIESSGEYYSPEYKKYYKENDFRRILAKEYDRTISEETLRGFMRDWTIPSVKDICYNPTERKWYYNTFISSSITSASSSPFLDEGIELLISNLCHGDKESIDWIHKAILYKLTNLANVRIPCVVFYWVWWSGKSTFIDFLKTIFWEQNVMGNLRQSELAGAYDFIKGDKLIYEFAEITSYNANIDRQMLTKLKNMVFAPTLTVNPKWRPQYQTDNFGWYFVSSNSMRPLVFDSTDSGNRRFVCFKSNRGLVSDEVGKIQQAISNKDTIENYIAWLIQEYNEVLDYTEFYTLENEDKALITQNSQGDLWEFISLLKEKYTGKRLPVSIFNDEIQKFSFNESISESYLKGLFKSQAPFRKLKWTVEWAWNVWYYDIR